MHPIGSRATLRPVLDDLLDPVVQAARDEIQNPRVLSDRIAVGRALWRELVIGFAAQLGELDLGFTQLAALYAVSGTETLSVSELADLIGRSPSATSRIVSELVARGLLERTDGDGRPTPAFVDADGRRRGAPGDGSTGHGRTSSWPWCVRCPWPSGRSLRWGSRRSPRTP